MAIRAFQSMEPNQRCCLTSSTPFLSIPSRLVTSAVRNILMMDLAYLRLRDKVLVDFFEELDFAFEDVLVDDHGVFVGEGVDA